jgi:hypothetical protein
MRTFLFSAAVVAGVIWANPITATAEPLVTSGSPSVAVMTVERIGWRRQFRRYGYPVPYIYYPPAYGYYAPPPAYADYPPSYGDYPPPVANGDYPSGNGGYAEYPPENGDYPPADGEYGDYPPDGS